MVYGMVNAEPAYAQTTNAINGFSDLILERNHPSILCTQNGGVICL